jgi:antitoxin (DNA-binding transcriptional repressor) of toxin-antitoxin stability system
MSATITLEEAQATLKDLIHRLAPGEEVIVMHDQKKVGRIVGEVKQEPSSAKRNPGACKGMITFMADDFDAPLEDITGRDSEEVVVPEEQKYVVQFVGEANLVKPLQRPAPGLGKGFIEVVSDDSEHLTFIEEYMK